MDLTFTVKEEAFRDEAREFLRQSLSGEFEQLKGRGGPGDEDALFAERKAWEQHLGRHGYACLSWPRELGGRAASFWEEVIWNEEYARARAPGRVGHIGAQLLGPTVLAFGTDAQKQRYLPPIARGDELWCQGYSEPNAGSDLAGVETRATLVDGEWRVTGQKVWTSLAQFSDHCFVLCRTTPGSRRHEGLSYLLVPMRQPGVRVVPIQQMTGSSEFNEVFFDEARAGEGEVIGPVGGGWKIAMATLGFERGVSTLGQQAHFLGELREITERARALGKLADPALRQRLAEAWMGLRVMRLHALRTFSAEATGLTRASSVSKLHWATWHRELGKLAMDILGPEGLAGDHSSLTRLQQLFLFSRSDTIYAGSNEIQRNIIAERALGLPR
ncbi:MAG: acyl-CoA dehydrogenase family protein [Polyangiaceae bacterium]|nr:acyl-CoA dehydrogenase family protein [Polyangiaceae bacterium]